MPIDFASKMCRTFRGQFLARLGLAGTGRRMWITFSAFFPIKCAQVSHTPLVAKDLGSAWMSYGPGRSSPRFGGSLKCNLVLPRHSRSGQQRG